MDGFIESDTSCEEQMLPQNGAEDFEVGLGGQVIKGSKTVKRFFCESDLNFFHRVTYFPAETVPLDPRCSLVLDQGSCRDYNIRWYYDKQANACAQFWYGGCNGNKNRFDTEEECKRTCVISRSTGTLMNHPH